MSKINILCLIIVFNMPTANADIIQHSLSGLVTSSDLGYANYGDSWSLQYTYDTDQLQDSYPKEDIGNYSDPFLTIDLSIGNKSFDVDYTNKTQRFIQVKSTSDHNGPQFRLYGSFFTNEIDDRYGMFIFNLGYSHLEYIPD